MGKISWGRNLHFKSAAPLTMSIITLAVVYRSEHKGDQLGFAGRPISDCASPSPKELVIGMMGRVTFDARNILVAS